MHITDVLLLLADVRIGVPIRKIHWRLIAYYYSMSTNQHGSENPYQASEVTHKFLSMRVTLGASGLLCSVLGVFGPALAKVPLAPLGTIAIAIGVLSIPGIVLCLIERWRGIRSWFSVIGLALGIVGLVQFSAIMWVLVHALIRP